MLQLVVFAELHGVDDDAGADSVDPLKSRAVSLGSSPSLNMKITSGCMRMAMESAATWSVPPSPEIVREKLLHFLAIGLGAEGQLPAGPAGLNAFGRSL